MFKFNFQWQKNEYPTSPIYREKHQIRIINHCDNQYAARKVPKFKPILKCTQRHEPNYLNPPNRIHCLLFDCIVSFFLLSISVQLFPVSYTPSAHTFGDRFLFTLLRDIQANKRNKNKCYALDKHKQHGKRELKQNHTSIAWQQ